MRKNENGIKKSDKKIRSERRKRNLKGLATEKCFTSYISIIRKIKFKVKYFLLEGEIE